MPVYSSTVIKSTRKTGGEEKRARLRGFGNSTTFSGGRTLENGGHPRSFPPRSLGLSFPGSLSPPRLFSFYPAKHETRAPVGPSRHTDTPCTRRFVVYLNASRFRTRWSAGISFSLAHTHARRFLCARRGAWWNSHSKARRCSRCFWIRHDVFPVRNR